MPPRSRFSSWITCPKPNSQAVLRLFCFPYAGGSASIFREWPTILPQEIEVCPVQLPGREERLLEKPFDRIEPLVQTLGEAIQLYLDKPFALFGYSMGSLLCFELARYLRAAGGPNPVHVLVASHRAPHLPDRHPQLYDLPQPEFLQKLRTLNGTSEEVLRHEELMQLLLPMLRADFALSEMYTYSPGEPLACPLSAFGGLRDKEVNYSEIAAWEEHTSVAFTMRMFPGDHFFLQSDRTLLIRAIVTELAQFLR